MTLVGRWRARGIGKNRDVRATFAKDDCQISGARFDSTTGSIVAWEAERCDWGCSSVRVL